MTPEPPRREGRRDREQPNWGLAFGLGIRLGVGVTIGLLGGLALDSLLGSRPVLTLLGTAVGVTAAFYTIWDVANRSMRR